MADWTTLVTAVGTGVAAAAAAVSSVYAWRSVKLSSDESKSAQLTVQLDRTVSHSNGAFGAAGRTHETDYVVVTNVGPAIARDVVVRFGMEPWGTWGHWPLVPSEHDDRQTDDFAVRSAALPPSARIRRMLVLSIGMPAPPMKVAVSWRDGRDAIQRDEFEIEIG